jgi:hypothetical protein
MLDDSSVWQRDRHIHTKQLCRRKLKIQYRSRIHERTISLWVVGIVLRVFRLEVSVHNVPISKKFRTTFAGGGGGGRGKKIR